MTSTSLSLSPITSSAFPSPPSSSSSLLSIPSPISIATLSSTSSRRKLSPPTPLSLTPSPASNPPPYCSSPPLISLSSPLIPSSPTKSELSKEPDEEEEEYPHVLATPTQQSYFVQLSGLFESEFSSLRIVGGEVAEKQMIEKIDSKERRERKVNFQEPTKEEKLALRGKYGCCIIA